MSGRREEDTDTSILSLMASAGLGGSLVGVGAKALSPALRDAPGIVAKLKALGKAGLLGGTITAGLTGLGGAVGEQMLGTPTREERENGSPWTRRAGLGGIVGGGLAGAALGGLYGSGALGKMAKMIPGGKNEIAKKLFSDLPTDNVIADYIRSLGLKPSVANAAKAAAVGGAGLGAGAGYLGADEGMQADVIDDERLALEREMMRRKLYGS